MRENFVLNLGGNKQTKDMVAFTRSILHMPGHQELKLNLLEASTKYLASDPVLVKQKDYLSLALPMECHTLSRQVFWGEIHDKKIALGVPGLYYAYALSAEQSTLTELLYPAIEKFDKKLQSDPQIGDNTLKKVAATYQLMLATDNTLSEEERDTAFNNFLVENILITEAFLPRDAGVYDCGMRALTAANFCGLDETKVLTTRMLLDDNRNAAEQQGVDFMSNVAGLVGQLVMSDPEQLETTNKIFSYHDL